MRWKWMAGRTAAATVALLAFCVLPSLALAGGVYFVKEGDSLYRIGRLFGVGVEEIRAANPLMGGQIQPGDRLRIPDPPQPAFSRLELPVETRPEPARRAIDPELVRKALCREETVYHAVQKGETLTAIARRYETTVQELQMLNSLRSRSRLAVGQRLLVRKTGPRTHVVRKGETLTRVAAATGVPVEVLRRFNSLATDALAVGQRLVVEPCDPLAAAGSAPPPLDGPGVTDEFLAAVAEASLQASREADAVRAAPPAAGPAPANATAPLSQRVIDLAKTMLNIPYRFGGTSLRGIDCSAYVQRVFSLVDLALPRTAREQFRLGDRIDRAALAIGDLVFFRTYASFPSHVGIYLGDNLFIHASSVGRKVTIDSLEQGYYRKRFLGGRRVIDGPGTALASAP